MRAQFTHTYQDIISMENLLDAWKEFVVGKKSRRDVQLFERDLMTNIIALHSDLATNMYYHSTYEAFNISDPKPRNIHKASVRDRLLHHAMYRLLYPFFDRTFISDSYSCRLSKGTHKAGLRFRSMAQQVSCNSTHTCWVLQCDIRKFFASIDQQSLITILKKYIPDQDSMTLLKNIIVSFQNSPGRGLPLGNLTSQLFVNVYMNEFDQHMKHRLKVQRYIRYADDFVIISDDRGSLVHLIPQIQAYLGQKLQLILHPHKVSIKTLASGVDFLGWVHFPDHRVLRTATKRGMIRRIQEHATNETLQSYLGLLRHGDTHKLKQETLNQYWLWASEGQA